jgi:hypothetical protein
MNRGVGTTPRNTHRRLTALAPTVAYTRTLVAPGVTQISDCETIRRRPVENRTTTLYIA